MTSRRLSDHIRASRERVRISAWPIAQAAAAGAIAWWITHDLLGHQQPFFAPIAAVVALSTSGTQRARRSAQLVTGVLLGIGVAVALQALLGHSAVALGAIVFGTMLVALAVGAGFIGEGMMFANQAAASAILVVALHHQGTGAERALDAVVGAAVAVVIGTLLFPANPLRLVQEAENALLRQLAEAVRDVLAALRRQVPAGGEWTLTQTARIHEGVARLHHARRTARAVAKVAPRRWPMRAPVHEEDLRAAQMDLLANAVLTLIRTAGPVAEREETLPPQLDHQLTHLEKLLTNLADHSRPWPPELTQQAEDLARSILEDTAAGRRFPVVTSVLETTARDLLRVVE